MGRPVKYLTGSVVDVVLGPAVVLLLEHRVEDPVSSILLAKKAVGEQDIDGKTGSDLVMYVEYEDVCAVLKLGDGNRVGSE